MVCNLCTAYGQLPSELLPSVLCSFLLFFFSALSPTRFTILPLSYSFSLCSLSHLSRQITCSASFLQGYNPCCFFEWLLSYRNIKKNEYRINTEQAVIIIILQKHNNFKVRCQGVQFNFFTYTYI